LGHAWVLLFAEVVLLILMVRHRLGLVVLVVWVLTELFEIVLVILIMTIISRLVLPELIWVSELLRELLLLLNYLLS
jgi:hypothetical protein